MSDRGLIAELKRRNVHRAAVFYAGLAWLLVQVATQVFPFFEVPDWAVRVIVIACVIGFPFALAFSWFYEWTPQGIKREADIDRNDSVTRQTGKAMDKWIIAVLALAVVLLLADRLVVRPAGRAATTSDEDKSVAVLPFENLSDDHANAYFAVGIQDEILTRLAKVGALKVVSRTSTAQYEGRPGNLPEIAAKLGVAHILEGSVQKVGNKLRINVQLIRAADDNHLWAEIYDRGADDILGVQGEVAMAIAQALDAKLSGAEKKQLAQKPTLNPAAYDAYLRGLSHYNSVFSPVHQKAASADFAEALHHDPDFAMAWAYKSIVDGLIYAQTFDRSAARLELSRSGYQRAMQLAPDAAESWLARGYFLYRTLDFDGARSAFAEAGRRLPNSAEVVNALGLVERRAGHYEQALTLLQQALDRDPANLAYIAQVAETLVATGRTRASRALLDRVLTQRAADPGLVVQKAISYITDGNLDAASATLAALPLHSDDSSILMTQLNLAIYRRNYAAAIAGYQAALSPPGFVLDGWSATYYPLLGWAQRWQGDERAAQATFSEGRSKVLALREHISDNGYLASSLSTIEAGLGEREAARRDAQLAVDLAGNDVFNRSGLLMNQALTLALAGLHDEALSALEQLARNPIVLQLADLRYSPMWDSLRDDARFKRVLEQAEATIARLNQAPP